MTTMTQQQQVNTMIALARSTYEELNRDAGIFFSPIAKMRNHVLAKEFFGFKDWMSDADVVSLLQEASAEELLIAEIEGQLMVARVAEQYELDMDDAYRAVIDKAEAEAQAAFDKVLAETEDEDKADAAYSKIMDKAEDKANKEMLKIEEAYLASIETEDEKASRDDTEAA